MKEKNYSKDGTFPFQFISALFCLGKKKTIVLAYAVGLNGLQEQPTKESIIQYIQ